MAHLKQALEPLDMDIEQHIQSHPNLEHDRGWLRSIKGIGEVVPTVWHPVFQTKRFKNAPPVAAYLGLFPSLLNQVQVLKSPAAYRKRSQPLYAQHCILQPLQPVAITLMSKHFMSGDWIKATVKCALWARRCANSFTFVWVFWSIKHLFALKPLNFKVFLFNKGWYETRYLLGLNHDDPVQLKYYLYISTQLLLKHP